MKIKGVLLLWLAVSSFWVSAQQDSTRSKIKYFNSFHAGGLFGKKGSGSGESFTTIHGVRLRKFALGVGAGYDAYDEWRAIPVFGSAAYNIFRVGDNPLFIQLNVGYAKAWYVADMENPVIVGKKRGPYFHPVLGYSIRSDKFNIYLTAGYKFQEIDYERSVELWDWWGVRVNRTYIRRNMERISIQLGFGFH